MPEDSARAHLRDLPTAELHLADGGHLGARNQSRRDRHPGANASFASAHCVKEDTTVRDQASHPTIARIWRGRTRRDVADEYEAYNYEVGIRPLIEKAMGVQTLREDRAEETEFITISYWESIEAMSRFTGGDPTRIHHLDRDSEFLIELPSAVQILRILASHGNTGGEGTT
jgi:heme-degrading monooxygenase HmoA